MSTARGGEVGHAWGAEDANLELLDGENVLLNTPTASGKSLIASAMLFATLVRGSGPFMHEGQTRSRRP